MDIYEQDNHPRNIVIETKMTKSVVTSAMSTADRADLVRDFSLLGVLSLAWNCVNVFGGLSFIFVVGFSAGGLPAILYGL